MATEIGAAVTVRGTAYRVVNRRSTGSSGAKFYGRFVFTLADAAGKRFTAYGKAVSHNSTLTEVMPEVTHFISATQLASGAYWTGCKEEIADVDAAVAAGSKISNYAPITATVTCEPCMEWHMARRARVPLI